MSKELLFRKINNDLDGKADVGHEHDDYLKLVDGALDVIAENINFSVPDPSNFTVNGETIDSATLGPNCRYLICTPTSDSTVYEAKIDLSFLKDFESLTLNDIYTFFSYSCPNTTGLTVGSVVYEYDNMNGILSIKTNVARVNLYQNVYLIIKPKSVYELPLVFSSTNEFYIDMTSIPNYKNLRTTDIIIQNTTLLMPNTSGIVEGMQTLYYDNDKGILYYRSTPGFFRNGSPINVFVAIASDAGINPVKSSLLFPDGTGFYLDEQNGVKGYNTDPERGADTFFPFNPSIINEEYCVVVALGNGATVGGISIYDDKLFFNDNGYMHTVRWTWSAAGTGHYTFYAKRDGYFCIFNSQTRKFTTKYYNIDDIICTIDYATESYSMIFPIKYNNMAQQETDNVQHLIYCPQTWDASSKVAKIDITSYDDYANLTIDDILVFPSIGYGQWAGSGSPGGGSDLSYEYDPTTGIITVIPGTPHYFLSYGTANARIFINAINKYSLPFNYVSGTQCYIDLTSIPNYNDLKLSDIGIQLPYGHNSGGGNTGKATSYNNDFELLYNNESGKLVINYKTTAFAKATIESKNIIIGI